MCLAIPGKVVEINGDEVTVDYGSEKRKVMKVFEVNLGDYVIVSNKIIIMKVPEQDAINAIKFLEMKNES